MILLRTYEFTKIYKELSLVFLSKCFHSYWFGVTILPASYTKLLHLNRAKNPSFSNHPRYAFCLVYAKCFHK